MSVPANDTPLPAATARPMRSSLPLDVGVLDHHHRVGAAGHHAAGGDGDGLAGPDGSDRHDAGVNHFVGQAHPTRHFLRGAEGVLRHDGEAVHVGAVERRHVHRRHDVGGEHAAQRVLQRHLLDAARRQVERRAEPPLGFVAVEHLQELLLPPVAFDEGGPIIQPHVDVSAGGEALAVVVHDHEPVGPAWWTRGATRPAPPTARRGRARAAPARSPDDRSAS